MKKAIPYIFALVAGLAIWTLLVPSLVAKRGNANIGGECLIPVYCVAGTAAIRSRRRNNG